MSRATDADVRNLCHMTQSVVDQMESLEGRVEALEGRVMCDADITDRDDGHTVTECILPKGHAPACHDNGAGMTWTDGKHWQGPEWLPEPKPVPRPVTQEDLDEALAELRDALTGWNRDGVRYRAERDGWKAKHAALRDDVEQEGRSRRYDLTAYFDLYDARDPQANQAEFERLTRRDAAGFYVTDPDTVTLRRDDVEELLRFWIGSEDGCDEDEAITRRVRAALGWGDEA